MKGTCLVVRSVAPSTGAANLSSRLNSHVASCLPCQAELARYSKLRRHLGALAGVIEPAPGRLAAAVADAIASDGVDRTASSHRPRPVQLAAATGAVVAAAAGAVAVAVWRQTRAVA